MMDQKFGKDLPQTGLEVRMKTFGSLYTGFKSCKVWANVKNSYLFCQPCSKLVYLFKTPSKCLFWLWDEWVSETAADPGLYEPLLLCLCVGFPRSADHFPLLPPECDTFTVFSMIIPKLWSPQRDDSRSKNEFQKQACDTAGNDHRVERRWMETTFILLSLLSASDSCLMGFCVCVFALESVCVTPSRAPPTGMQHHRGERERQCGDDAGTQSHAPSLASSSARRK